MKVEQALGVVRDYMMDVSDSDAPNADEIMRHCRRICARLAALRDGEPVIGENGKLTGPPPSEPMSDEDRKRHIAELTAALKTDLAALLQPAPSRDAIEVLREALEKIASAAILSKGRHWHNVVELMQERAREALAKADAIIALGGEQWREMDSAPKDGTHFLAYCNKAGRVIMRRKQVGGIIESETWAVDRTGWLTAEPHLWMPLPTPPEQARDGGK